MRFHNIPGLGVAVIRRGRLAWARGYDVKQAGSDDRVDAETMLSVGSVSKLGSAVLTLQLVDAGKLDLDRDVNAYLEPWKIPANQYTAVRPVTLRRILSDLAGFTVSGFPDFQPTDSLPTILETLDGKPPAKTPAVRVAQVPGSAERYSGGGVTVEQLAIEDVTNLAFPAAAKQWIFEPLGNACTAYGQWADMEVRGCELRSRFLTRWPVAGAASSRSRQFDAEHIAQLDEVEPGISRPRRASRWPRPWQRQASRAPALRHRQHVIRTVRIAA